MQDQQIFDCNQQNIAGRQFQYGYSVSTGVKPMKKNGGQNGLCPSNGLLPSTFPPGTDRKVVQCFQMFDKDDSGFIDDKELQKALTSQNQSFSISTVRLLICQFTCTRKVGPKEFALLYQYLMSWKVAFERFDRDRSGRIDASELEQALLSLNLGYGVSRDIVELLVSKYDKTAGRSKAIDYDKFIECCVTVKGLTEKFNENKVPCTESATFTYEAFMMAVLPFIVA